MADLLPFLKQMRPLATRLATTWPRCGHKMAQDVATRLPQERPQDLPQNKPEAGHRMAINRAAPGAGKRRRRAPGAQKAQTCRPGASQRHCASAAPNGTNQPSKMLRKTAHQQQQAKPSTTSVQESQQKKKDSTAQEKKQTERTEDRNTKMKRRAIQENAPTADHVSSIISDGKFSGEEHQTTKVLKEKHLS